MKVLEAEVERYFEESDGEQVVGSFTLDVDEDDTLDMTYDQELGFLVVRQGKEVRMFPRNRIVSMTTEREPPESYFDSAEFFGSADTIEDKICKERGLPDPFSHTLAILNLANAIAPTKAKKGD